jgi:DNA mismatch repair protein MutL
MSIRVLEPAVAARIAAGEVVERPSSIVKELIENAIDAGATTIRVTVPGDPVALVIVADDGNGIDRVDLDLAFVRHATSKIPDNDVTRIGTLGFRGEALHAASAISCVTICSRTAASDCAWEISASPTGTTSPAPAAGAKGTTVYVKDIFANVPARLKFLKSRRAEMASIRTVFDNAALTNPSVEFRLTSAGRDIVHRATDTVFDRVKAVLGEAITDDAVAVSGVGAGMTVQGCACVPTRFRRDRRGMTVAVNGRVVSDPIVVSGIREAYSGLTAPGNEPISFIDLRIEPSGVDVNVDPRKSEVRFADPAAVHSIVSSSVREALDRVGLMTSRKIAAMAASLAAASVPEVSDRRRLPLGRVIGQVNGSWILSETVDGIVVVDQHAAHERVLLERLRDACAGARAPIRLSTPAVVPLREEEIAVLQDNAAAMAASGFDLDFVPGAVFVASVPDVMAGLDTAVIVAGIASSAVAVPARAVAARLTELMAEAACHAAIKAGDTLSNDEADRLLREIEATPNAGQCNHGRPTVAFLTDDDLRRLFARS